MLPFNPAGTAEQMPSSCAGPMILEARLSGCSSSIMIVTHGADGWFWPMQLRSGSAHVRTLVVDKDWENRGLAIELFTAACIVA